MERAVALARTAEREGNLPVGAVLALDGEIVAEGRSRMLEPVYDPGRHAELEAVDAVDPDLWPRAEAMTCYTTLEPCVMCAGTLLLHGVGRVVFGARDERGGGGAILEALPPMYDRDTIAWVGPVAEEVCGPLYRRAREMFRELPAAPDAEAERLPRADEDLEALRERLEHWRAGDSEWSISEARRLIERTADAVEVGELGTVLPYAAELFRRGGFLKDYRALEDWANRAGERDVLERVEATVRDELPDVWVRRALEAGDPEEAVSRWYEIEGASRARHVAEEVLEACGEGRPQLLISCRLAEVSYLVGRGGRRHYREACGVLRRLRDELERVGASEFWPHVVETLRDEHDSRPAFLDEMDEAGFE